jgi:hypothetical protein
VIAAGREPRAFNCSYIARRCRASGEFLVNLGKNLTIIPAEIFRILIILEQGGGMLELGWGFRVKGSEIE